ncbi:MAG: hypothetical protein H7Y07_15605 [Pyrinomonadaceae bacterium]|nr:hypothetical protein [Sphingobacteriaceae bacterium]
MNKITALVLGSLTLLFSACSSLYMPNVPNTPMLSTTGELHASGHVSLKGNASLNTAYAVSDNLGVILNGSFINREQNKKDFSQNLLEIGAGYFTSFGVENERILEVYAGVGRGSSDRTYKEKTINGSLVNDRQEINFSKSFIQVNYSTKKKRSLKLFGGDFPLNYGTALRASYINMNKFIRNDINQVKEDNIFLEPIFFTRMHLNNSVQLQYTTGSNFGLKNRKFLTAGNSVFSLGLVLNVGK